MYSRLLKHPKDKSFFLFGPRGVGKSSWVKSALKTAVYIDLLEAEIYTQLTANPQRLTRYIPSEFHDWVIIDEVQKIPALLDEIHRLIETKKHKFVLTGSSARKLRRESANLLAGRALTLFMYPLTCRELGKDFNLKHSLLYGHLPCAYTEPDPKSYLQSYVKTYLQEEIQQEGLTRSISAFARFLEAASFSQASVLNISAVSRECSVERKVVEHYFTILEDLLIGTRVPIFTKRAKRQTIQHPKFYFFDTGVYRAIRPMGPLDTPEFVQGHALETLLFQELKAVTDYSGSNFKIYYWRTSTNLEVDFILYGESGLVAIEVKSGARVDAKSLSGLKAFLDDYPQARAFFLYGGNRVIREGRIQVLPIETALVNLSEIIGTK